MEPAVPADDVLPESLFRDSALIKPASTFRQAGAGLPPKDGACGLDGRKASQSQTDKHDVH